MKADFMPRLLSGLLESISGTLVPNLILTEGVHHIPKEILSLGLLPVEIKAQGGDEEKGGN